MTLQPRSPEAISADTKLLQSLGWRREKTPDNETDWFFGKGDKTAIVYLESSPEFSDKPIFKRCDFDEDGYAIQREFTNPLNF